MNKGSGRVSASRKEGRTEGRKEEHRRLNRVTDEAKKECLREHA
jgi:hypothetical protein